MLQVDVVCHIDLLVSCTSFRLSCGLSPIDARVDVMTNQYRSDALASVHETNVSKNLVSDWERGVKKPGGPALLLLTVIPEKGLVAIS
jgi:hypothetical protein